MARAAQIGVVGNAGKHQVGAACPHLLATPPFGAFVFAHGGTNPLAHVLDTQARLAIGVFGAFVTEATFSRQALQERNLGPGVRVKIEFQLGLHHDIGKSDFLRAASVDNYGNLVAGVSGNEVACAFAAGGA